MSDPRARPDEATGRWSVAFPRQWWYPAAAAGDVGRGPVPVELFGTPLVLFRDGAGAPRALLDRCPHRNVPLSLGRVAPVDGTLQCGYHGWRFDGSGRCRAVPGLEGPCGDEPSTRDVPAWPVRERDGFVWVWAEPSVEPHRDPFALPDLGHDRTAGEVVFGRDLDCTLHASLENALDVPHTAFLHGGAFRRPGSGPAVTAERRDLADGVEVRYSGEPAAFGPLRPKRLAGVTFDHWDRFFLPSVAQIEYRVQDWLTIVNTILHLPLGPHRTRAWFVLRWRSPLPAAALAPVVAARGRRILAQDVEMLEAQDRGTRRFGGERYTSTPLDLMGNAIWRLLRRAERADSAGGRASGDGAEADETPDLAGTGDESPTEVTLHL